jgi:membrane fusion protein, multidrug efflux system
MTWPDRYLIAALFLSALASPAQTVDLAPVVAKPLSRNIELPAEIAPYLTVSLHARVAGYVESVLVDRGSAVKQGDTLVELSAPEMEAQISEAAAKVQASQAEQLQAEAQLAAAQATSDHLKEAARTPGAVAGNDLLQAEKLVDAARAVVESRRKATAAATAAVDTLRKMQEYLKISAPFEGIVTDRLVHPGALVGPAADVPLLVIQQVSRLRIVVPVPEEDAGGIVRGAAISFHVPAWPDRNYTGTVARLAHALDAKTRTMAVELDTANRDGSLAPGMYASVQWPVRHAKPALLVPKTSVVTTTERTFVIRSRNGHAEWVEVKKGEASGDLIEVLGNLQPGDMVVRRATDETREGSKL